MAFALQSGVTAPATSNIPNPLDIFFDTNVALEEGTVNTSRNEIVFDCNQSGTTITATSGTIESGIRNWRTYKCVAVSGATSGGLTVGGFYHIDYQSAATFGLYVVSANNGVNGKTLVSITAAVGTAKFVEVGAAYDTNSLVYFGSTKKYGRNMLLNGKQFSSPLNTAGGLVNIKIAATFTANNGAWVFFVDTSGEWVLMEVTSSDIPALTHFEFDLENYASQSTYVTKSSGTFDHTSLDQFLLGIFPDSEQQYMVSEHSTSDIRFLSTAVLTGSGTLEDAMNTLVASSPANEEVISGVYSLVQPIEFGDGGTNTTTLSPGVATVGFAAKADGTTTFRHNYTKQSVSLNAGTSDGLNFNGTTFLSADTYDFDCTTSAPNTTSAVGMKILNADLDLDSDVSLDDASFVDLPSVVANASTVDGGTWDGCEDLPISIVDGKTAIVRNATNGLLIDAAGTYDARNIAFVNNTNDIQVTATTGTVNIVKLSTQAAISYTTAGATVNIVNRTGTVTFENLTSANVEIFNDAGTSVSRVTGQSGSYPYQPPIGSTGTWRYVVDRAGYSPLRGSFNATGNDATVDGSLSQLKKSDGSAMYTGSATALIDVVFDFITPCMCLEVGDAIVSAQQMIDASETALLTVDGMKWQNDHGSLVRYDNLPGVGDILFFGDHVRVRSDAVGSVNSGVSAYILSSDGTVVDGVNGSVAYVGGIDLDPLSTKLDQIIANLPTINSGIQAASKLIPYSTDLA